MSRGIFHRLVADNTNPRSLASAMRRRRFELFQAIAGRLPPPVRVLDVGGSVEYWSMLQPASLERLHVTLLNLHPSASKSSRLAAIVADARDMSCLATGSFDVVFSNSVIEHVGGPSDQLAMAREVRRVGRYYCVQTPNRFFPVEPHFQFPLFQFLPRALRIALVRRASLGWHERVPDRAAAGRLVDSVRLLTVRQLATLFPDAVIDRERFLGLTKSVVARTLPPAGTDGRRPSLDAATRQDQKAPRPDTTAPTVRASR